jgi:hypothetical protein
MAFFGAFIAGVYLLRFVANTDCGSIVPGSAVDLDLGIFGNLRVVTLDISVSKACGMLKGCFALGIMQVVFFFVTGCVAWVHGGHVERSERKEREAERRSHRSHRSHRSGSHGRHRSGSGGGGSRRSSHSHHRAYV